MTSRDASKVLTPQCQRTSSNGGAVATNTSTDNITNQQRPILTIVTHARCGICGDERCNGDCCALDRVFEEADAVNQRHGNYYSVVGLGGQPQQRDPQIHAGSASARAEDGAIGATPSGTQDDEDDIFIPPRSIVQRTKSCGVHAPTFDQEKLRRRTNVRRLHVVGLPSSVLIGFGEDEDEEDEDEEEEEEVEPASIAA